MPADFSFSAPAPPAGVMSRTTPLPTPRADWALFLDFDGTLAHIAATPCGVSIDPRLRPTLAALNEALDGAVALVSGRTLAQLDDLLTPLVLPAAGLHGLERRRADGTIARAQEPAAEIAVVRQRLRAFAARVPGVLLEDKGLSLALHYRDAPERQADCLRAADEAVAASGGGLHLLEGKMIYEIKSDGTNKGTAIEAFLAEPPFAGRTPAFFGDDVTDEDGFAAVNRRGGVTVCVGDGAKTMARWRIASVGALLTWLAKVPEAIAIDAKNNAATGGER
jgi:trehalose 6-phosphate phosphatase